jgi:hypothetical protein
MNATRQKALLALRLTELGTERLSRSTIHAPKLPTAISVYAPCSLPDSSTARYFLNQFHSFST